MNGSAVDDLETRLATLLARKAAEADVRPDLTFAAEPVATVPRVSSTLVSDRRRNLQIAGLAVAAVLAVGVVAVAQWQRDSAAPAGDEPQAAALIVPAAPRPGPITVFPDVGPLGPNDGASYSQIGAGNIPQVSAVVAQRAGDTVQNGIGITVYESPIAGFGGDAEHEEVDIRGVTAMVWTMLEDTTIRKTVVFPGTPVLMVHGLDPVRFLQAAQPAAIRIEKVTDPAVGGPNFTLMLGAMPLGYEVVVPPFELPLGHVDAQMSVNASETSDGAFIGMSSDNPLGRSVYEPVHAVDINGHQGWIADGRGKYVGWEQEPSQFVTVGGVETAEEALALARRITFIDEASWRAKYHVDDPNFGAVPESPPDTVPADAVTADPIDEATTTVTWTTTSLN